MICKEHPASIPLPYDLREMMNINQQLSGLLLNVKFSCLSSSKIVLDIFGCSSSASGFYVGSIPS